MSKKYDRSWTRHGDDYDICIKSHPFIDIVEPYTDISGNIFAGDDELHPDHLPNYGDVDDLINGMLPQVIEYISGSDVKSKVAWRGVCSIEHNLMLCLVVSLKDENKIIPYSRAYASTHELVSQIISDIHNDWDNGDIEGSMGECFTMKKEK